MERGHVHVLILGEDAIRRRAEPHQLAHAREPLRADIFYLLLGNAWSCVHHANECCGGLRGYRRRARISGSVSILE